jgi:hypothetical protein
MSLLHVGDRLVLGDNAGPFAAARLEALRPDGSRVEHDWAKPPWRLKVDQPGPWHWWLLIRDDKGTRVEKGEIEVLPATRTAGLLDRLMRRRS